MRGRVGRRKCQTSAGSKSFAVENEGRGAHFGASAALGVPEPRLVRRKTTAPYGPSAEAKSARLTSWRATAARTVRVCVHLPRAFVHPGLGAWCRAGRPAPVGQPSRIPSAAVGRPVSGQFLPSAAWAGRDARSKGGVLSPTGGHTKQQPHRVNNNNKRVRGGGHAALQPGRCS